MLSRNFIIAILASLVLHVTAMTAVSIVNPAAIDPYGGYTRVDFLGPILKKTAFDIMLEYSDRGISTSYDQTGQFGKESFLDTDLPRRELSFPDIPVYRDLRTDAHVRTSLMDHKVLPDLFISDLRPRYGAPTDDRFRRGAGKGERKVIYRPEMPAFLRGLYGGESSFRIRFRLTVDDEGGVRSAEMLTTTGYPELDMMAAEYVKNWIFEPADQAEDPGGRVTVELSINAQGG